MTIIQDNARSHKSVATMEYLSKRRVSLLAQPAYSLDFNLCDRYLFNYLENQREKAHLTTVQNLIIS
jgi:hypothetical protein